jgi:hypothetical protein
MLEEWKIVRIFANRKQPLTVLTKNLKVLWITKLSTSKV